jgi:hypothetical protein
VDPEPQLAARDFGRIKIFAILISGLVLVALVLTLTVITRRGSASLPPTPFPGSAYVVLGELDQRAPGSYFSAYKAGDSAPFGPGSLARVTHGLVELNLPGNYQLAVFGSQQAPALIELTQAGIFGQASENTIKLLTGSLVARSGPELDRRVRLVVNTDAGAATISGTVMGARYNPYTGIMEVDCLFGSCDVETRTAAAIQLEEGQRATIDSLGQLAPPGLVNLALYSEYPLRLWVPEAALERQAAAASVATFTPTATQGVNDITPTATPVLPTWTPAPPSPTPAAPRPTWTAPPFFDLTAEPPTMEPNNTPGDFRPPRPTADSPRPTREGPYGD